VYVNSVNHGYDAATFVAAMPTERLRYLHVAGHYRQETNLIIDTHGAAVVSPVWRLLETCYLCHGIRPTLLERDFNIPAIGVLLEEIRQIRACQRSVTPAASGLRPFREHHYGRQG
ncbi:MAG: multinuclear nonheme iron-dependent oxidase, partial [Plesiomonas shigelloides]